MTVRASDSGTRKREVSRSRRYLRRELIELSRRPDPDVLLAKVRERKQGTGSELPANRILKHRDADLQ